MAKRLIINADDFGISPQANEAVEYAHTKGVLTSATIMTNMPHFKDAVAIAKRLPRLGVGVHLNLFKSKPVSDDSRIECLLDSDGNFRYSPQKLAFLSMFSHKIRTAIRIEMTAQIYRLNDSGLHPTHLDSHKHIHFFPAIYPIVCSLAWRFKISAVRYCREPAALSAAPWPLATVEGKRRAKQLRKMAGFNRLCDSGLNKTNVMLGLAHIGRIDVSFFKAVSLYSTAQTAEVMTHPATSDDAADAGKLLKLNRKAEFEALCDERTRKYLHETGIELIHYGDL
jgi:hopanoid biosynthesis associated protein HpnK